MSDRERWVVYPLLFLAIGLGLRNDAMQDQKNTNPAEVDSLRCKTLEVLDAAGKPKIKLGISEAGTGVIETAAANGAVMTELGTGPSGGHLTLFDADRQKLVLVGFDGQMIGVAAGFVGGGQYVPLNTVPIIIRRQPSANKPTDNVKPADSNEPDSSKPNNSTGDQPSDNVNSSGSPSTSNQNPSPSNDQK